MRNMNVRSDSIVVVLHVDDMQTTHDYYCVDIMQILDLRFIL